MENRDSCHAPKIRRPVFDTNQEADHFWAGDAEQESSMWRTTGRLLQAPVAQQVRAFGL